MVKQLIFLVAVVGLLITQLDAQVQADTTIDEIELITQLQGLERQWQEKLTSTQQKTKRKGRLQKIVGEGPVYRSSNGGKTTFIHEAATLVRDSSTAKVLSTKVLLKKQVEFQPGQPSLSHSRYWGYNPAGKRDILFDLVKSDNQILHAQWLERVSQGGTSYYIWKSYKAGDWLRWVEVNPKKEPIGTERVHYFGP